MKCDICKKRDASVFLQLISSDSRREIHWCMECAHEMGFLDTEKLGLMHQRLSILNTQNRNAENDKSCPVCGNTLSAMQKTQTAGCPECYSYFADEIKALQKKSGVEGAWTGSLPHRLGSQKSVLSDRVLLMAKLNESLAREDYEKAAIYRDRLRLLEKTASLSAAGDTGQ